MNRWKEIGVWVLVICMLLSLPYPGRLSSIGTVHAAVSFVDGDGSEEEPFLIATAEQLNEIRSHPTSHFVLIDNIDLSTDPLTVEWEPIGNFSGSLDGDNYRITNLYIQESVNPAGLFNRIIDGAEIKNLEIHASEVRTGSHYAGILAAVSNGSAGVVRVTGVRVTGEVYGRFNVGGLIGQSIDSEVTESYSSAKVEGLQYVGGLIGETDRNVLSRSSAEGDVKGSVDYVGGLIGRSWNSKISESYASGKIEGRWYVGGIIGISNGSEIFNTSASGNVDGSQYTGGLIGGIQQDSSLLNSSATGNVTGNGDYVGGLIGNSNNSKISNSSASGSVVSEGGYIGGLIGDSRDSEISDSFAIGDVKANLRYIGGLIGRNRGGDVSNSYATGAVVGDFGPVAGDFGYVGGLIGRNSDGDEVKDSYATGNVTANSDYIGGLIGYAVGSVTDSYATGEVNGERYVGGLIGHGQDIAISRNTAEGDVTGQGNYVGGLVGRIQNETQIHDISSNSATGSVTGQNYVGGLAGRIQNHTAIETGDISNNHAAAVVTGEDYVGGLFGLVQRGNVSGSSASGDVRGNNSVGGLIGEYITGTITESNAEGSVTASRNEGGLVGSFQNGDVSLSYATGEVIGLKNTGGLIGELENSTVTYSYAAGSVAGEVDAGGLIGGSRSGDVTYSFATGNVSGCDDIGGFIGDNDLGEISNSYAAGNVAGICGSGFSNSIGGLVGDNSGTIENSFVIGSVTGHHNVGGLVGDNRYAVGNITNSYYDIDLTGQSDNKGQGLTSEQMKNIESYDGWDFDSTWKVDQHHYGYPYLAGMQGMQAFLTYMGNNSNDDSGLYASRSYRVGSLVTIEELNWTRTGYLFQGWSTESEGSGVQYEIGDTTPLNSNLLLYATWKRVSSGSSSAWWSNNANLANLIVTIDGEQLALLPEFTAEETSYRAETTSSEVTIKATPSDARATVTLEEERLVKDITVVLVEGDNVFEIVVKAENGTIKTYSLTIHRVEESEGAPTLPQVPGTSVCTFSDVTGHWAEAFICEAFERGIVNGHTETRFSPQSDITRVEFVAILLRTLGMTSSASSLIEHDFVDQDQIPAWATSMVHIAVEKGIIQGYPDLSLRPLDSVSRAEMVTIIGRAMEWKIIRENTTFHDDADIPHWAKGYVQDAVLRGLLNGRGDNRFSPSESANRAEATVLLLRLWHTLAE